MVNEPIAFLPDIEHKVTMIAFTDISYVIALLFTIALAAFLFNFIVIQVIEVVRKINRKQKSILDVENNELLKAQKMSDFGKKYLRGGRIGK